MVFILAIYIAGSNPDKKLNMLASTSFFLAGVFTITMIVRKFDIPPIVARRIEQIFYTLFVFTPGIHIRFCYSLYGKNSPRFVRWIDVCSFVLSIVIWTPYFLVGFMNMTSVKFQQGGSA